jgi:hypothetical protein
MSMPSPGQAWAGSRQAAVPSGVGEPTRGEALRGVCFCLLYDLCCWLAAVQRPVPAEVEEYSLAALREVADPRLRLSRYVNPAQLQSWAWALQPFLESGATLEPELGESGSFQERGRDEDGRLLAELRFSNRSHVVDRDGQRTPLPPQDWVLDVRLSPDLGGYVESAIIRRA